MNLGFPLFPQVMWVLEEKSQNVLWADPQRENWGPDGSKLPLSHTPGAKRRAGNHYPSAPSVLKTVIEGLPWWSCGYLSELPLHGAQV